ASRRDVRAAPGARLLRYASVLVPRHAAPVSIHHQCWLWWHILTFYHGGAEDCLCVACCLARALAGCSLPLAWLASGHARRTSDRQEGKGTGRPGRLSAWAAVQGPRDAAHRQGKRCLDPERAMVGLTLR